MSARKTAFAASESVLEEAQWDLQGNAVDAVVVGVLAAAARNPSTFLGPVVFMVGGAGVGTQVIDGRVLQPGMGEKRPRGFVGPAPDAARVGAPRLPAAVSATLAAFGSVTPTRACTMVSAWAKKLHPERAKLIERVGRVGSLALQEVAEPLLASVGKAKGGLLTREDLEGGVSSSFAVHHAGPNWDTFTAMSEAQNELPEGHRVHLMMATDARGTYALAAYAVTDIGVAVPELELVAPLFAVPVLRGAVRTKPGTPCDFRVPAAFVAPTEKAIVAALGCAPGPSDEVLHDVLQGLSEQGLEAVLSTLRTYGSPLCTHMLNGEAPRIAR
jgi:hypothetical protein